jgi:hypothetical protein
MAQLPTWPVLRATHPTGKLWGTEKPAIRRDMCPQKARATVSFTSWLFAKQAFFIRAYYVTTAIYIKKL